MKGRKEYYFLFLVLYFAPVAAAPLFNFDTFVVFSLLPLLLGAYFLKKWEEKMRQAVFSLVDAKMKEVERGPLKLVEEAQKNHRAEIEGLLYDAEAKKEEKRQLLLQIEDMKKEFERLQEAHTLLQKAETTASDRREMLLRDYQQTISEQRMILEKKQRYIGKLESKVRDLMYEIRSLLQLEEREPETKKQIAFIEVDEVTPSQNYYSQGPVTTYDLALLLQRTVKRAETFTGATHLAAKSKARYLDLSDSFAIDLRRLFDLLRDETSAIIIIYSQIEEKVLFANNMVRTLLGWSPEKFVKDFLSVLGPAGAHEWKRALSKVIAQGEISFSLSLQNKQGLESPFQAYVGVVTSGPFAGHIIALLAPVQ